LARRVVNEKTLAATECYLEFAEARSLALPTFAVAWTLTRDFVGSTIIGATRVAQLDALLAAADVTLDDEAIRACDQIHADIPYPMG
jgi:aryl-alcohol dehydrogenase-like predicted oxidoreductase